MTTDENGNKKEEVGKDDGVCAAELVAEDEFEIEKRAKAAARDSARRSAVAATTAAASFALTEDEGVSLGKNQERKTQRAYQAAQSGQLQRNATIHPRRPDSVPGAFPVEGAQSNDEEAQQIADPNTSEHTNITTPPLDAHLVHTNSARVVRATSTQQLQQPELIEARAEDPKEAKKYSIWILFGGLAAAVVIVVAVVLALTLGNTVDDGSSSNVNSQNGTSLEAQSMSTLEKIRQRGFLRCAYREYKGHFFRDTNGNVRGFEAAMCQAVGAAIFGDNPPIKYTNITGSSRFPLLNDGELDLVTRVALHNMERDVHEANIKTGLSFSVPYKYDGMKFAGDPFYVHNCVEKGFKHVDECSGIRICTGSNTTEVYHRATQVFPERLLIPQTLLTTDIAQQGLIDGKCNVLAHIFVQEVFVREAGYEGDYVVGAPVMSKMPSAIATAQGDPQFSDFANAVLLSLFLAEEMGITKESADEFPQTLLLGEEYKDMFRHAIRHEGNYGEISDKFLGDDFPRQATDRVNDGSSGLMYSLPFGPVSKRRDESVPLGETLQQVLDRGELRCGLRLDRPGFAIVAETVDGESKYEGMDVDYCRALSASLFGGDDTALVYVPVEDTRDGAALLVEGEVDVVAGAMWTLEIDIREESTGIGFAYSKPYFFAPNKTEEDDNLCLMTRQEDPDWAEFAFWTVEALVHAEENNITQLTSNSMPEVYVYGESLKRQFRNAVLAVGCYADIYERNLAPLFPRSGRNLLNRANNPGPQVYIPPLGRQWA